MATALNGRTYQIIDNASNLIRNGLATVRIVGKGTVNRGPDAAKSFVLLLYQAVKKIRHEENPGLQSL